MPWFFHEKKTGSISINRKDQKIAWNLYCDLITRDGVANYNPDEENFHQTLKSWIQFQKYVRQNLKNIDPPLMIKNSLNELPKDLRSEKTELLSSIMIKLITDHLHPFLRHWYPLTKQHVKSLESKKSQEPLDILEEQKKMKNYSKMLEEIKGIQTILNNTAEALRKIASS